VFVTWSLNP
ncbi:putative membrane protein, partial [Chlamydia psittaci 02DC15]